MQLNGRRLAIHTISNFAKRFLNVVHKKNIKYIALPCILLYSTASIVDWYLTAQCWSCHYIEEYDDKKIIEHVWSVCSCSILTLNVIICLWYISNCIVWGIHIFIYFTFPMVLSNSIWQLDILSPTCILHDNAHNIMACVLRFTIYKCPHYYSFNMLRNLFKAELDPRRKRKHYVI